MPLVIDIQELQNRAITWHERRFPNADCAHVGLKLGEETGEVQSAILSDLGSQSATGDGDVLKEIGDVIINCMVIAGRYYKYDMAEILAAVIDKLNILTDPTSGHRSAVRG